MADKEGVPTGRQRRWIGADILWIAALMVYVLAGIGLVPFHADESTMIMMARDYYAQFVAGDLNQVLYHDPPLDATAQHLRLLNGTLAKDLIGLATHLAGYGVADLNEQWLWGAGWDWNVDNGHMPTEGLLLAARWPSSLFAALSVLLMFGLGWQWGGRWMAYPASLLFALHPVILIQGRRAYQEGGLLFFSLVMVFLAVAWGRAVVRGQRYLRPKVPWRLMWGGALLLGIVAGLNVASKHSGAVPPAAAFLALFFFVIWRMRVGRWQALSALVIGGIVALGVFLLLNPAWWDAPLTRVGEVLALRNGLVADQQVAFPESVYPDVGARLVGLLHGLTDAPPVYYEAPWWADFPVIQDQIATYTASPWTGIQYGVNGLTTALSLAQFGLALVGLGWLWGALRRGEIAGLALGLWLVLTLALIVGTIPLAWQRYLVPLYPIEILLAGIGLGGLARRIVTARRRPGPAPA